jgi:SAM-dependent methyltransferase
MVTQALGAAVRLGLAELVRERPRSAADLAVAADADVDAISRLLRALASVGVFADDEGTIRHTPLSELLLPDAPASFAGQALILSGFQYRTWADALQSFRTGEPAFSRQFGKPLFEWLSEHPEEATQFNQAMAGQAGLRRLPLHEHDWSGASSVVDVGGGTGATLIALLAEQPHLQGTVLDLPHVEEQANRAIAAAGLSERCHFVPGSFFDSVPSGADVYVLSAILHDWGDEAAARILEVLRQAVRSDSVVLLLESVIAPGDEPDNAKLLDLHMLVVLGGRERSEQQWRALLAGSGFTLVSARPGIVEARPAS